MLDATDTHLNTGYFTLRETVKLLENKLSFNVVYWSNFLNRVHDDQSIVQNNIGITTAFNYIKGQKIYAELGIRNSGVDNADVNVPFNFGFTIPTGKVLDLLSAQIEIDASREDVKKSNFLMAYYIAKNAGKYCNFKLALFSNAGDLSLALRFTSKFK